MAEVSSPGRAMQRLATALGCTEGQAYTLVIGTAIGLVLAVLGIPPTLREVTRSSAASGAPRAGTTATSVAAVPSETTATTAAGSVGVGADPGVVAPGGAAVTPGRAASGSPSVTAPTDTSPARVERAVPARVDASNRGLTSGTIAIGYVLRNAATPFAVGAAAPPDPQAQEQQIRLWVDVVNKRGGVAGRRIVPTFAVVDPTQPEPDASRPACIRLTEDQPSFLVLGAGQLEPVCITEQHRTLALTTAGLGDDSYLRAEGRLFDWAMGSQRLLGHQVELLHRGGALRNQSIGIVWDSRRFSRAAARDGVVASLTKLGYKVTATAELDGLNGTQGTSQVPVEVTKMRTTGVQFVFLATTAELSAQWAQAAEAQAWAPFYALSDVNGVRIGAESLSSFPASFQGVAHSVAGEPGDLSPGGRNPVPAVFHECRAIYKAETGTDLDPESADPAVRREFMDKVGPCRDLLLTKRTAESVSGELSAGAFASALHAMSDLNAWTFPAGSNFRPDKAGAPNGLRKLNWARPCPDPSPSRPGGCWVPATQYEPTSS